MRSLLANNPGKPPRGGLAIVRSAPSKKHRILGAYDFIDSRAIFFLVGCARRCIKHVILRQAAEVRLRQGFFRECDQTLINQARRYLIVRKRGADELTRIVWIWLGGIGIVNLIWLVAQITC